MKSLFPFLTFWMAASLSGFPASAPAAERALLFEIGKADDTTAEFALAPKDYAKYRDDPLYIVGDSEAKRDWPYVHPGPDDPWAGGRRHTFTIVFSLGEKPSGDCRLLIDLTDTHGRSPPVLSIRVNDREVGTHRNPPGGGDASVFGDPSRGKEHRFSVEIPAAALKGGTNEIAIENLSGSWVLYDWIGFEAPAGIRLAPTPPATFVHSVRSAPALIEVNGKLCQTVQMTLRHIGEPLEAVVRIAGADPATVSLKAGATSLEVPVPAVEAERTAAVEVTVAGKEVARKEVLLKPVRKWVIYLLPHSHVDIGYTKIQTEVEKDHWRYLEQAIEAARRTAEYPPGARFKWNVEVLWAVEGYLKQASLEKQEEFLGAVKKGWIGLQALYGNELTALCSREELIRLVDFSQRLSKLCGVKIDSAMISDVPGYTWGITSVLAAAGVRYFSIGPNGGDRIGYTLEAWADKPFWWIAPDGRSKVLVWIPGRGYWQAFGSEGDLYEQLRSLEAKGYPYDMVQIRYCLGDNAGPGIHLSDIVKDWNSKHAYPKLAIATASEMMEEFERRHGASLPEARGDFTPYWEDGAASSALETEANRAAAGRLTIAEALWALRNPRTYPVEEFRAAWRNVILYDEHTWGAHNSISEPESDFVRGQWAIKQAFALDADRESRGLLKRSSVRTSDRQGAVEVWNSSSWTRTGLVGLSLPGDRVIGPDGKPVPSQRLSDGNLIFIARDVPPFGALRFIFETGEPLSRGSAKAEGATLRNETLSLTIDEKTGAISSLKVKGIPVDLVDGSGGLGLNDYLYVPGRDPKDAKRSGPVKIAVKDPGPLAASILVEGEAPGCRKLTRIVQVIDGLERVDIADLIDKEKVRTKEGVHIAFPFNVPGGTMRMDIPWAVVRPEEDQLPGSCKNWFTVGRWVDVSNADFGVTWGTVDAPLVEVGAITAETPWIRKIEPSRTLYSYVMNNYWHTNYKADQEGPVRFMYTIQPHRGPFSAIEAARFGVDGSERLGTVLTSPEAPAVTPSRLRIEPEGVIVTCLKPADDGKGLVLRLFGAGGLDAKAALVWSDPKPESLWLSNLAEDRVEKVTGPIDVPAWGFVTLRGDFGSD